MPLLLRLGQYTWRGALEGLGRYIEATGAVDSSRISTELYGRNIPIQLMPASLMRGPDC